MKYLLNQEEFFKKYNCREVFNESCLSWEVILAIYEDYVKRVDELNIIKDDLISILQKEADFSYHSIHGRVKDPEHLIEKIIRKVGIEQSSKYREISVSNYRDIIHDIIGIRILSLNKENWERVYSFLNQLQESSVFEFSEEPIAYTRYGDRDIYANKIREEHTNRGYRSQHYIIKYENFYCEVQARTLAEETYGEFDHKVKYPYRNSNNFLKRLSSIVSQHLDAVDELISTGVAFSDESIEQLGREFGVDVYRDWKATSKPQRPKYETEVSSFEIPPTCSDHNYIVASNYISYNLLRKGQSHK